MRLAQVITVLVFASLCGVHIAKSLSVADAMERALALHHEADAADGGIGGNGAAAASRAAQLYRAVITTVPTHAHALHNLGVLQHGGGNNAAAERHVAAAVAAATSNSNSKNAAKASTDAITFLNTLGVVRRARGRLHSAQAAYERALAVAARSPTTTTARVSHGAWRDEVCTPMVADAARRVVAILRDVYVANGESAIPRVAPQDEDEDCVRLRREAGAAPPTITHQLFSSRSTNASTLIAVNEHIRAIPLSIALNYAGLLHYATGGDGTGDAEDASATTNDSGDHRDDHDHDYARARGSFAPDLPGACCLYRLVLVLSWHKAVVATGTRAGANHTGIDAIIASLRHSDVAHQVLNDFPLALLSAAGLTDAEVGVPAVTEAESVLRATNALWPGRVQTLGNLALLLMRESRPPAASAPSSVPGAQLATSRTRRFREALCVSRHALSLAPSDGRLLHNTANLLERLKREDEAVSLWRRSVEVMPSVVEARVGLAIHAGQLSHVTESRQWFADAVHAAEAKVAEQARLHGDHSIAATAARIQVDTAAIMLATASIPRIARSAHALAESRQLYSTELDRLLWHLPSQRPRTLVLDDPVLTLGCGSLGYYAVYQGSLGPPPHGDRPLRVKLAEVYRRALASLRASARFVLGQAGEAAEAAARARAAQLRRTQPPSENDYLQPRDHVAKPPSSAPTSSKNEREDGRIRVGFVSAYFFHHSVGLLMQGVIARLDRRRYKVAVISLGSPPAQSESSSSPFNNTGRQDEVLKRVQASAEPFIDLTSEEPTDDADMHHRADFSVDDVGVAEEAQHDTNTTADGGIGMAGLRVIRRRIAALRLDVLVFCEIGMDARTYFLAFSRLALRTVMFWGHAITSGIGSGIGNGGGIMIGKGVVGDAAPIDGFVSSFDFEEHGEEAQARFRWDGGVQSARDTNSGLLVLRSLAMQFASKTDGEASDQATLVAASKAVARLIKRPDEHRRAMRASTAHHRYQERAVKLLPRSLTTHFLRPQTPPAVLKIATDAANAAHRAASIFEAQRVWRAEFKRGRQRLRTSFVVTASTELASGVQIAGAPATIGDCARVYLVPQTLYKLHPSFDGLLFRLLRRDLDLASVADNGRACVVMPQGNRREWGVILSRRILKAFRYAASYVKGWREEKADKLASRIVLVAPMRQARFFELIATADVVLDPFPLGGGRSTMEVFASGSPVLSAASIGPPPIVSLLSRTSVLQLTYGFTRAMLRATPLPRARAGTGEVLSNLTADASDKASLAEALLLLQGLTFNESQYIEIATVLANDMRRRDALSSALARRRHALYEQREALLDWDEMLLQLLEHPRPRLRTRSNMSSSEVDPLALVSDVGAGFVCFDDACGDNNNGNTTASGDPSRHARRTNETLPEKRTGTNDSHDMAIPVDGGKHKNSNLTDSIDAADEYAKWGCGRQLLFRTALHLDTDPTGVMRTIDVPSPGSLGEKALREAVGYAAQSFASAQTQPPFTTLKTRYLRRVLAGGVVRCARPVHARHKITVANVSAVAASPSQSYSALHPPAPSPRQLVVEVRVGDELNALAQRFSLQRPALALGDGAVQALAARLQQAHPEASDEWWVAQRDLSSPDASAQVRERLHRGDIGDGVGVDERDVAEDANCVTLAITTCKRLAAFQRTARALASALGFGPGGKTGSGNVICAVLVVDDASSASDRYKMMQEFPHFGYVFKQGKDTTPSQRGHARSMNLIVRHVRTRYVLYFEDDWLLVGSNASRRVSTNEWRVQDIGGASAFMSPPSLNGTERAPRFLRDALAILRAVNAENATGDVGAPLAQVLLNYQGGGWRRHVLEQVSMTHQDAMGDSQPYASTNELHTRSIEYRRHEFGASHPEHTFSYWPGFSLNPALWDLRTLRAGMARMCSHHRGSCARKPPHSSDAAGSGTAWTPKHHGLYFDTGVQLFEQDFSLAVHDAGLRVAYLPYETARHVGTDEDGFGSAYELNNMDRDWYRGGEWSSGQ